ncbi:TrbG/VirB9 family P-type conjugative transfer protein [Asticcacaulis sp. W401b]|uniref:TrbG/VirB9 family P-type conjugative transfer protein n=1 Tax=Asticcacaulis sp. W401b TaxID=3388666 RepID=UPI0039710E3F
MRPPFLLMLAGLAALVAPGAKAAVSAVPKDPRIRTVDYVAEGVLSVPVSKGVVTRIVLERGEKIIAAATGVPSKCDVAEHLWCVVADADANEVWVKPKAGAGRNNLELKTDRRDYSIDLSVGALTTYRIVIRYPRTAEATGLAEAARPDEAVVIQKRIEDKKPVRRNEAYTLQSNGKGADITPKGVFDDGTFTYFRFPGNSELPTIFVIGSDGKEARTNYNMTDDLMVVQRLGRKFVLRLGKSVVSVWNENFDAEGVVPPAGTTVDGVARETLETERLGAGHAN